MNTNSAFFFYIKVAYLECAQSKANRKTLGWSVQFFLFSEPTLGLVFHAVLTGSWRTKIWKACVFGGFMNKLCLTCV